jgi:hypothetical protein
MPESKKRATAKTATAKRTSPPPRPSSVTAPDEWLAAAQGEITELPSGKSVRVISPGMQAFINADLIPNELMPIILSAINAHQPPDTSDLKAVQQDPQMLLKMVDTVDRIFAYCVVEPKFELSVPIAERQPGVLYTDMASTEDKTFIFQLAVGGTRDLARFREEQAKELAALQAG